MPRIRAKSRRTPKIVSKPATKPAPIAEPVAEAPVASSPSFDAYVLIDRSSSMGSKWDETLGSINTYVRDLHSAGVDGGITVALFDEHAGFRFDVIRTGQIRNWHNLSNYDGRPRGMTPLNDAIIKLVELSEKTRPERAAIVICTDGYENASRATRDQAKQALDRCRARGWEVLFLGADFDAIPQAISYGATLDKALNLSGGFYSAGTRSLASSTANYGICGQSISFNDADRAAAQGRSN